MWDLFICHASDDKEIAKPIYDALFDDLWVWYDDAIFTQGESISRTIDLGLRDSRMGLVILSENFFKKDWPEKELNALISRETGGIYRILPIWYKITKEFVASKSPILADRKAVHIDRIEDLKIDIIIDAVNASGIPNIPISYLIKREEIPAIRLNIRDVDLSGWEAQSPKAVDNYELNTDWQTQDVFINPKNQLKLGSLTHRYLTIKEAKKGFLDNKKDYEHKFGKLFKPNIGEESYGYVSGSMVEVTTFRTANLLITTCFYVTNNRHSIKHAEKFSRIIDRKIRTIISKKKHD